jgi:RNA chaperone Hfq
METNLLDRMLCAYLEGRTQVTITLQNKARVSGTIRAFDGYIIVMDGDKREILYRHAISSVAPHLQEDRKQQAPASAKPAPTPTRTPRPPKAPYRKPAPAQPLAASGKESLNTSMKDGLLKWMEQRTAK